MIVVKKWSLLLLVIVLVLCCCVGCGKEEKPVEQPPEQPQDVAVEWMPYGLEFGMTYDEAKANDPDMTAIELTEDGGYMSEQENFDNALIREHFDVPFKNETFWDYNSWKFAVYSFNREQELNGFYFLVSTSGRVFAKYIYDDMVAHYNTVFKVECTTEETETGCVAKWEKDGVAVEVVMEEINVTKYWTYATIIYVGD